ncbi:hypothetical protein KR054_007985 [Drosophila jambulina]|nr:hypothetical protein KR054_007985 [Drosophila jambulina]
MISIAEWLANFSAGLLLSVQAMRILKTVNEQEGPAKISDHISAASDEPEFGGPESLGSEEISSVLQHILNGERNASSIYLDAKHNNIAKGQKYALGSESLNRMLEDIMTPAESVNTKEVSFEPAMDI